MDGFIPIPRSLLASDDFMALLPNARCVLLRLIETARWHEGEVPWGRTKVPLGIGQGITSRNSLCTACRMSDKAIRVALRRLEDDGFITLFTFKEGGTKGAKQGPVRRANAGTIFTLANTVLCEHRTALRGQRKTADWGRIQEAKDLPISEGHKLTSERKGMGAGTRPSELPDPIDTSLWETVEREQAAKGKHA